MSSRHRIMTSTCHEETARGGHGCTSPVTVGQFFVTAPLVFSRVSIFCPWTRLGTSVPQTPWFVSLSKFLATRLQQNESELQPSTPEFQGETNRRTDGRKVASCSDGRIYKLRRPTSSTTLHYRCRCLDCCKCEMSSVNLNDVHR